MSDFTKKVLLSRHIFQEWLHPDWREGFKASVLSYTHLVVAINFTCCSYNVSGYCQPIPCISVEPSAEGIEVSSFSFSFNRLSLHDYARVSDLHRRCSESDLSHFPHYSCIFTVVLFFANQFSCSQRMSTRVLVHPPSKHYTESQRRSFRYRTKFNLN